MLLYLPSFLITMIFTLCHLIKATIYMVSLTLIGLVILHTKVSYGYHYFICRRSHWLQNVKSRYHHPKFHGSWIVAAADAGCTILYFCSLLHDLNVSQQDTTALFEDNRGALLIVNTQHSTTNMQHSPSWHQTFCSSWLGSMWSFGTSHYFYSWQWSQHLH